MKNQDVYLVTSSKVMTYDVIDLLKKRGAKGYHIELGVSTNGNIIKVIDGVIEVRDKSSTERGKILISINDIENYSW